MEESDNSASESRSRSPSPDDSMPSFSRESTFMSDKQKRRKARNIAATTEQLLFSSEEPPNTALQYNPMLDGAPFSVIEKTNGDFNDKSLSYVVLPVVNTDANGNNPFQEIEATEKRLSVISEFKPVIAGSGLESSYLISSYVVDGHENAVLCVECTDDVLFSSSADGIVKIWDLMTNTEIQKMNHGEAVKKVCYCEYTRLAFAASSSEVTLWDVRQNPAACDHIFRSSGLDPSLTSEYEINDISLNHYGTLLYAASSRSIRIWDLRMLHCLGALDIGYGSNATCIAVNDIEYKKNRIVCGSQDKSIKVFEISENDYGLHRPKFDLSPPHHDGVEALAVTDHSLFSGGRDMSIRKWDLDKRSLDYDLSQVHNNWICALEVLQERNCLLSGCRSGHLKLWTVDKCHFLEEIVAHRSSINSITSNNSLVFTASSDCTIGVWKMKSET